MALIFLSIAIALLLSTIECNHINFGTVHCQEGTEYERGHVLGSPFLCFAD